MSLNWSAAKVKNYEELEKEPGFAEKLKAVVFDTMNCGVNPVTEKNYKEFYRRMLMLRLAQGVDLKKFMEQLPEEFVHQMVGLGTNASTKTTRQFDADVVAYMEGRVHAARNQ